MLLTDQFVIVNDLIICKHCQEQFKSLVFGLQTKFCQFRKYYCSYIKWLFVLLIKFYQYIFTNICWFCDWHASASKFCLKVINSHVARYFAQFDMLAVNYALIIFNYCELRLHHISGKKDSLVLCAVFIPNHKLYITICHISSSIF